MVFNLGQEGQNLSDKQPRDSDISRKFTKNSTNNFVTMSRSSFSVQPKRAAALVGLQLLILHSHIQHVMTINPVIDLKNVFPYLINKTDGQVIEPRDYMDFDNIYSPSVAYKRMQTVQGRNYHLLKAFDFANYYQSDHWHYSSEEDLKLSAYPVANKQKCSKQLDWLERKLNDSRNLFAPGEQHVQFMSIMDAFGKPESNTFLGHGYWLGSHYECMRLQLDLDQFEQEECTRGGQRSECLTQPSDRQGKIRTRYCVGKARDVDWPSAEQDDYSPKISYKIGLCLPETCETLSIREHQEQIQRLMLFSMPDYWQSRLKLADMYCLPDARSPIRALSLSGRIFLTCCCVWLILLVAATCLYSCCKRHKRDLRHIMAAEQAHRHIELVDQERQRELEERINSKLMLANSNPSTPLSELSPTDAPLRMVGSQEKSPTKSMLSTGAQLLIIKTQASLASLSKVANQEHRIEQGRVEDDEEEEEKDCNNHACSSYRSSSSSLSSWLRESPMAIRLVQALSIKENLKEFQQPPMLMRQPGAIRKIRINLNALDCIKCLCCILVIFGHIVFIHMQHLSNILHTIELSHEVYPRALIAFFNFVDTFFIISGMLTAYFVFKRFNKETFGKPFIWIYISLLRLLRLSPVYVLVFWFVKTLTVHLSEGPVWDYGTDMNSNKGLCMNDHWWKSILYLGNYGSMQPLCILPAWSIIVDAQYSLIIPPVLFLVLKYRRLGYTSLILAVVVSTANMSHMLATQTAVKTSDVAKVRLHVYPLISRFAAEFYNTAVNRVGPVAIGIIGGHILYLYDIGSIRRWPWFMRGSAFKFVLFMHIFIFILPTIGRFTDNPEESNASSSTDMTIFILSNATVKPIWSLINTIFLLRLVTDLRSSSVVVRLMSHNIWHCLGKLCFASYLIHYEIILILLKSRQEGLMDLNWGNVAREFSLTFLISTAISYLIYVFYEAPINKLITLAFSKPAYTKLGQTIIEANVMEEQNQLAASKGADGQELGGGKYFERRRKELAGSDLLTVMVDGVRSADLNPSGFLRAKLYGQEQRRLSEANNNVDSGEGDSVESYTQQQLSQGAQEQQQQLLGNSNYRPARMDGAQTAE